MMGLSFLDTIIIFVYIVFSLTIAIVFSKRASKNTSEFFLSGRNLPWWIAGTAMVATTFAADTPLAVTELVAKNGVAGNWLWWNMLFGGMLTVFFFARLWRRSGVLTDVEFIELRYSGKPAAILRGFKAIYLGLFMNVIILGWVNLAMVKILTVIFPDITFFGIKDINILGTNFSAHLLWVGLILVIVAIYSSLSGLWGVAITDTFQFFLAMTGSIILAVVSLKIPEVGGIQGLKEKLPEWFFNFFPKIGMQEKAISGTLSLTLSAFIAYVGIQWWASWYPGAEPGGGGYVAQRMMSAKNEKHSLFATLWFMVAHYALRPWPWIIVALASVVLYPELDVAHKGEGYIMIMKNYLPSGLLGLLLAAFLAAYMSTVATQLNWGTSYIVNDFYRRFFKAKAEEKYYVTVARITTIILMIVSLIVTANISRISDAWIFILQCSAGIGLVLILRWYWWRINAWSEISAMIAPLLIYPVVIRYFEFPYTMFVIVIWTTIIWIAFTYLTPTTDKKVLLNFYKKVHPGGFLWKRIGREFPDIKGDSGYIYLFVSWISGFVLVYSSLFGIGSLIFGKYYNFIFMIILICISVFIIYWCFQKVGWKTIKE